MIPADSLPLGGYAGILSDLAKGRVVRFSQTEGGALSFTVEREGRAVVLRCPKGRSLVSGSTFAEVWRQRPALAK